MYLPEYWDLRYKTKQTGWNIGYASPPVVLFFEKVENKSVEILIPGAGFGFEVEALFKMGFNKVFYSDFSLEAAEVFKKRCPQFPEEQILTGDFFKLNKTFDFIVEHTFFSSLLPEYREAYALKTSQLLKSNCKLVGLFFNREFAPGEPPFGGSLKEYESLFSNYFTHVNFTHEPNSIKPRKGTELWAEIYNEAFQ